MILKGSEARLAFEAITSLMQQQNKTPSIKLLLPKDQARFVKLVNRLENLTNLQNINFTVSEMLTIGAVVRLYSDRIAQMQEQKTWIWQPDKSKENPDISDYFKQKSTEVALFIEKYYPQAEFKTRFYISYEVIKEASEPSGMPDVITEEYYRIEVIKQTPPERKEDATNKD